MLDDSNEWWIMIDDDDNDDYEGECWIMMMNRDRW